MSHFTVNAMSHFTVLVVTDQKPTDGVLEKALAPFHEFECTGIDNEYVQDLDITEKVREEYATTMAAKIRGPDGALYSRDDNRFYREPTSEEVRKHGHRGSMLGSGWAHGISWSSKDWGDGMGYRAKVHYVPEGFAEVDVPRADTQSFESFVKDWHGKRLVPFGEQPDLAGDHKYGYAVLGANGAVEKVIDRTNPNAEWDWYVLGGRWQGMLLVKAKAEAVGVGRHGLMGSHHGNSDAGGVDWCQVKDLDIERMKNAAVKDRQDAWIKVQRLAEENGLALSSADLDAKRRSFALECNDLWENWKSGGRSGRHWLDGLTEEQKTLRKVFYDFGAITTEDDTPIQDWIDAAPPLSTYAVLKDGQWCQRGKMGWWGISSNEKDESVWMREYEKLLRELNPDHYIAVVDCHI